MIFTITLPLPEPVLAWPTDVAAICQEIAEEDRRLAEAMRPKVQKTWPRSEENP